MFITSTWLFGQLKKVLSFMATAIAFPRLLQSHSANVAVA